MNTHLTIKQVVDEYLKEKDIAATTCISYRQTILYFFRWMVIKGHNSTEPQKHHLIDYKKHMMNEGRTPGTMNVTIKILKQFFKWVHQKDYIKKDIGCVLKYEKGHVIYRKNILTHDQVRHLLNSIERKSLIGKRDYLAILLGYSLALRCVELSRIQIRDIDFQNMILDVRSKGRQYEVDQMEINELIIDAISDLIAARGEYRENINDRSYLFVNFSNQPGMRYMPIQRTTIGKIITGRIDQAGLKRKGISAHSLRHSAGVHLIMNDIHLFAVQSFLRHTSSVTTQQYLYHAKKLMLSQYNPTQLLSDF